MDVEYYIPLRECWLIQGHSSVQRSSVQPSVLQIHNYIFTCINTYWYYTYIFPTSKNTDYSILVYMRILRKRPGRIRRTLPTVVTSRERTEIQEMAVKSNWNLSFTGFEKDKLIMSYLYFQKLVRKEGKETKIKLEMEMTVNRDKRSNEFCQFFSLLLQMFNSCFWLTQVCLVMPKHRSSSHKVTRNSISLGSYWRDQS